MNNNIPIVDASIFEWSNSHGYITSSKLGHFLPRQLRVKSPKTGKVLNFSINWNDPMAEDGWDGEFIKLVDEDRKVFLTINAY